MGWRLDPVASAIDAGEVVDGADYGVGSYTYVLGAVDDVPESEAEIAVALIVEVDGLRVAINGARLDPIVVGDIVDVMPVSEFFLDGLSQRVSADQAEAFVVIDWDHSAFLHEREFFVGSQRALAARALLVFFLGLGRGLGGDGLCGWFGDGCGRLRR